MNFPDGSDNVGVGPAATEITGHPLANLVIAEFYLFGITQIGRNYGTKIVLCLPQQRYGGADLTRGAITTLEAVVLDERLLDGMQFIAVGETFNGRDLVALVGDGQREAGVHAAAVDEDRAGAALPVVTAFFGAGKVQSLPQRIEDRDPRLQVQRVTLPVDLQSNGDLTGGGRHSRRRTGVRGRCTFGGRGAREEVRGERDGSTRTRGLFEKVPPGGWTAEDQRFVEVITGGRCPPRKVIGWNHGKGITRPVARPVARGPRNERKFINIVNCDPLARWYRTLETLAFGGALQRCRTGLIPWALGGPDPIRRVLLLGEGDGRFGVALLTASPTVNVEVVDNSAAMLARANKRHPPGHKIRFHQGEAGAWLRGREKEVRAGTQEPFDLIVTAFFLDCFSEGELGELTRAIAGVAADRARWLVADFRQPPGPGVKAWLAWLLLKVMYAFFGWTTGLQTRRLGDFRPHLFSQGFRPVRAAASGGSFLVAEGWVRQGVELTTAAGATTKG